MDIDVDTIFPRKLMKIVPLFYFPKLALEKSDVVRLVVGTTIHGRQLLDSLLQVDLLDEFLKESHIIVDDLRRLQNTGMFWHDIGSFPFPEMGDYLPAFMLLNGLNYTEIFKALYHCYVDELFDSGGKFDLQSLKVMLKKKRLPTADMEMKLLLEGVFDEYGYSFGMSNVARHRQILHEIFTTNVVNTFESLLKRKTIEYFAKLKGVMYERERKWPIEDEQVTALYRKVVEEQFNSCRGVFTKKGIDWAKAQINFWNSLDNYVTEEQLSRDIATTKRINDGIEKDAKVLGVPPALMLEMKNSHMLEAHFRPHAKQFKKPTLPKVQVKEAAPQVSHVKAAMSSIRQGRFAEAADIFERMLEDNKERSREQVYNLKFARIFCLYRSSSYDKLKSELKILIKNEGQTEESRFLPKYCLAYYYSKQYNFNESKALAIEINDDKFRQEQLPEWPEEGGYFDVLQFNKTFSSCSVEDRKKALDQLRNPPAPEATCVSEQCSYSKREIYRNDPSSSDNYCSFLCSEKCKHEYHFSCWRKMKKECKENFDENSLIGRKCFTDGCVGKFEMVTIFESNGRVKKQISSAVKEKSEQKAKKEKSKKKQKTNNLEKANTKASDEVAKPISSNSMSFDNVCFGSKDAMGYDEENGETSKTADDDGQKSSIGTSFGEEKPLTSRPIQSQPEEPKLVSNDQLRLLIREDEGEDINVGASKKQRRNRRQRGNSENKGLLSNTFDVLSIDEAGDEGRAAKNARSKKSKNNTYNIRVSSRTVSESTSVPTPSEAVINGNVPLHKSANEESGSSKSLNREQPLYGDWNLNEANHEEAFESTRNRRNDTLPSGFDFNVGVQGTQTQEQFRQPNVSTNAWKQSSFADVPQNTVPTFFTESVDSNNNFSRNGPNNHNMNNRDKFVSILNNDAPMPEQPVDSFFSGNRSVSRGRGRGFPEASSSGAPKKTKRINVHSNAPPQGSTFSATGSSAGVNSANEPTGFFAKEETKKPSHFGAASFDMNTNAATETTGTFESAPKGGVFSLFNKAQGIKQDGRSKFFDSINNLPEPPQESTTFSHPSTGFASSGEQVDSFDSFPIQETLPNTSASAQNQMFAPRLSDSTLHNAVPPENEFKNRQNLQQQSMTNVQQYQATPAQPQQQTQQHQPSPFYPQGFDQFADDRLTDEELRQLMTGGDNFMMAPRAKPAPPSRPSAATQQNTFQASPQQMAFFQHSQQAPQQHIPQFQHPFPLRVHAPHMPTSGVSPVNFPGIHPPGAAGVPRPVHIGSSPFHTQANPYVRPANNNLFSDFNALHSSQFEQFQQRGGHNFYH